MKNGKFYDLSARTAIPGRVFSGEELEEGTPARGDMGHFPCKPELRYRFRRGPAPDYGCGIEAGENRCNRFGPLIKLRDLEHPHRAVPCYRPAFFKFLCILHNGQGTDICDPLISGDLVYAHHTKGRTGFQFSGHNHILRKQDTYTTSPRFLHDRFDQFYLIGFHSRDSDSKTPALQKRGSHSSPDKDKIHLGNNIFQNPNLLSHLCPAQNDCKRSGWIFKETTQSARSPFPSGNRLRTEDTQPARPWTHAPGGSRQRHH